MNDTVIGSIQKLSDKSDTFRDNSGVFYDKDFTQITLTNKYGSHTSRLPGSDLYIWELINMFRNLLICATFSADQVDEALGLNDE